MRMVSEYVRLFNKIAFSNKIGLVITLILPIALMLFRNNEWISNPPPNHVLLLTIMTWWSFIISISVLNGVGVNQLALREQGFLKLFTFVSGSTLPIFIGNLISQFLFTFVSLAIFCLFATLAFSVSFLKLFFVSALVLVVMIIPLGSYISWIPHLPIKQETIASLAAIAIFPLLFLTTNFLNLNNTLSHLLLFNPVELTQQLSKYFMNTIFDYNIGVQFSGLALLLFLALYIVVGIYFIPRIKIITIKSRS